MLVYNTLLGAVSMAALGALQTDSHLILILMLLLGGCVRSMQFISLNVIAYTEVGQR